MPNIEEAARFAGADPECDRQVLDMCLQAAIEWYRHAKVPPREGDALYDFWVFNLTAWFFDNRGAGGDMANVPPYIIHSLHQLRPNRSGATT